MFEYTFNASALGLGGYFEQGGNRTLIPSLASVALAPTGGEGRAVEENYNRDGIAFTHAESRVAGYRIAESTYTTFCDILITNLRVRDYVEIAMLQGVVTSTRNIANDDEDEAHFELRAMYRGVKVAGVEVAPEIDIELCQSSKYEAVCDTILRRLQSSRDCGDRSLQRLRAGVNRREPVRATIVKTLQHPQLPGLGHVLPVSGFGTLHFGELLVKPARRRLNLLRIDLDSELEGDHDEHYAMRMASQPVEGAVTVGSGDGNGAPVWPQQ